MSTKRWSVIAGLTVAIVVMGSQAFAQSVPVVRRIWSWNVGPTMAGLSMELDDGGSPSHEWFDLSTNPDMSGASVVGDEHYGQGYHGLQSHATPAGLMPNTAYYFRAHVRTYYGETVSGIQSFRTAAATAPSPPSISLQRSEIYQGAWLFTFSCDGHGWPGNFYALWSTRPDMADAQRRGDEGIIAGPTGQGAYLKVGLGEVPDNTTIYVQGVAVTAGGEQRTGIQSVLVRNGPL